MRAVRARAYSVGLALAVTAWAAAEGAVFVVAPSGGDFTRIQDALDAAQPGDTIRVRSGIYPETVVFRRGGAPGAPLVLEAWPGERPILDGGSGSRPDIIRLDDVSHVRVSGFELRGLRGVDDGSGIRITGAGTAIEIRDNRIHDLRGRNAMGITVYGTRPAPISDLVVEGNVIFDCEVAPSEALTLNGNIDGFLVAGNDVHDVNNIGIDVIGGERDIQPDRTLAARNGTIHGNRVARARSSYGGGYAAGIYVDGGRDIVVERNVVTESDLGIEIGAENPGVVARDIRVRNNVLFANEKACLVFGGYAASRGRVRASRFTHNTCWGNDTRRSGNGELWIQYAEDNVVSHNIFHATAAGVLLTTWRGNLGNVLDHNLWYTTGTPRFVWNGATQTSLAAFRDASGQEAAGLFADPDFAAPQRGDFHLRAGSPAIDTGDPGFLPTTGETDFEGGARVGGPRVDRGADEFTRCGDGVVEFPEVCDDGNLASGDGCDANCTPTGCGNGIVSGGEACDDGNRRDGDCCDADCGLEPPGTPCDDGDPCTRSDACLAGVCGGLEEAASTCHPAVAGTLALVRGTRPTARRLVWDWRAATSTPPGEFGNPTTGGTVYTLCAYDTAAGASRLILRATAPPGPRWQRRGTEGYQYRDTLALPDGLQSLRLAPTTIRLKGSGEALGLPPLPLDQDPAVIVQLHAGPAACWTSRYASPARRNEPTRFRDSSE